MTTSDPSPASQTSAPLPREFSFTLGPGGSLSVSTGLGVGRFTDIDSIVSAVCDQTGVNPKERSARLFVKDLASSLAIDFSTPHDIPSSPERVVTNLTALLKSFESNLGNLGTSVWALNLRSAFESLAKCHGGTLPCDRAEAVVRIACADQDKQSGLSIRRGCEALTAAVAKLDLRNFEGLLSLSMAIARRDDHAGKTGKVEKLIDMAERRENGLSDREIEMLKSSCTGTANHLRHAQSFITNLEIRTKGPISEADLKCYLDLAQTHGTKAERMFWVVDAIGSALGNLGQTWTREQARLYVDTLSSVVEKPKMENLLNVAHRAIEISRLRDLDPPTVQQYLEELAKAGHPVIEAIHSLCDGGSRMAASFRWEPSLADLKIINRVDPGLWNRLAACPPDSLTTLAPIIKDQVRVDDRVTVLAGLLEHYGKLANQLSLPDFLSRVNITLPQEEGGAKSA